jgi:hypothetical protein
MHPILNQIDKVVRPALRAYVAAELVRQVGAEGVIRHCDGYNGGSMIRPTGRLVRHSLCNFHMVWFHWRWHLRTTMLHTDPVIARWPFRRNAWFVLPRDWGGKKDVHDHRKRCCSQEILQRSFWGRHMTLEINLRTHLDLS